jgi:hypothetical protein
MATMDDMGVDTTPTGDEMPQSDASIPRRRHAREVLAAQRLYLDRLEDQLDQQLRQAAEQLARGLSSTDRRDPADTAESSRLAEENEELRRQLSERQAELRQLRDDLEHTRINLSMLEHDVRVREALSAEALAEDERKRVALANSAERLADAEAQLTAARSRADQLRHDLNDQANRMLSKQDRMRAQRRRLVARFKAIEDERSNDFEQRLTDQTAELERRHAAQTGQFELRQAEHAAQVERLRQQMADQSAQQPPNADQLIDSQQVNELNEQLARQTAETERVRAEAVELLGLLEVARKKPARVEADPAALKALEDQLHEIRDERDALVSRLATATAAHAEHDPKKNDELQRRLELAVEDLREARRVNAELEAKLKRVKTDGAGAGSGGLDWEAQKEKLLASLEADDREDAEAVADRNTIEGTIRITDQIVAQKDREIAELKRLAGEQPEVDEAAVADLLDGDELVRKEREKLQQLEEEWRKKIGQAEIDISLERATLARQRNELEDKMRLLQAEQAKRPAEENSDEPVKPQRGRWLARLGLKDLDEPA